VHQVDTERAELRAAAKLLGQLFLKEVSAGELERLREPALAAALADFGVSLPAPAHQEAWLEERGADYHDLFLRPESGPLVQSLWTQGRYEGDPAVRVRQLATFAGVEFQRSAARGAAVDHLGSLLLLWSACDGRIQAVADEIVNAHLEWATRPLRIIESAGGFYGALAAATMSLVSSLRRSGPTAGP